MSKPTRASTFYQERMDATNWNSGDLCDPPTSDAIAVKVLIDELLGADWYVTLPENDEQTNTAAVYQIIRRYVDEAYNNQPAKQMILSIIKFMLGVITGLILYQLLRG